MKLQEKLNGMKQETIATKPPELVTPLLEETKKLVASGIADKVINIGSEFPVFDLPDGQGKMTNSNELLHKGPLVVSFYRGVW